MTTTRTTKFSQSTCIHCGRSIVAIPQEQAECQACHKRRLVTDLQRQIADKQRKAVWR